MPVSEPSGSSYGVGVLSAITRTVRRKAEKMSSLTTSTKCFIGRYLGLSTLFRVFLVVFVFFGSVTALHAATATWDANPESDILGYVVSYGMSPGSHPNITNVYNVTTWTLSLSPGRYYFVVQAYNTSGLISDPSSEVMYDAPSGPNIDSLSPSTGPVGTLVTISGANFGDTQGSSSVGFNGAAALATFWSATSIVVLVPANATSGSAVVTVAGVASNGVTFTVSTSGGLPDPWLSLDVGGPDLTGQAAFSAGTFSVTGAGVDIWDTNDQFQFVYQLVNGDVTITARVDSLQYTDEWAKVGVMIREDLTGNAPNAMAHVTPGHGIIFQQRDTRGAQTTGVQGFPGAVPQWIRLIRSGSTVSGYYSVDAITWTQMGTFTSGLPSPVYVGLAVTSDNPSIANTATFSNVTVTSP
jgi:hypothetical protein